MQNRKRGIFIGFIGLPGVGKSTLAKELAQLIQAQVFIEPGDEAWPIDHKKPWEKQVTVLENWLCTSNGANFRQARQIADSGGKAVVDAGIFLVNKYLINAPSMAYYYGNLTAEEKLPLLELANADWKCTAARPDVLVLLETDKTSWLHYMEKRGRSDDNHPDCILTYETQKEVMADAAQRYALEHGIAFIRFENFTGLTEKNARELLRMLEPYINPVTHLNKDEPLQRTGIKP